MTLVQLKHFLELARNGSFSKSADRLHITQPALSRSIKSLEEELGQPLFDRVGRTNELTAFGQSVLRHANDLVESASNLKTSGQQALTGHTGHVRLGLGSGPGALWMTPLLSSLARDYPHARLDIARGATPLLVEQLRERALDALILDIRSLRPASDLKVAFLCEIPGAFLCRKGHPLSKLKSVTIDQVRDFPVASTPLSDEVARLLMERYGAQAYPDQLVNLRCEEISSLVQVAKSTDAVVLAIRASAPDLVALPMAPPLNTMARFGWVTLSSRHESPLARLLHQMAKDMVTAH
jgi:DNA-binding transcriptional LysR family regulator